MVCGIGRRKVFLFIGSGLRMEDVIVGCCVRRTLQSEAKVLKHFFKGIVCGVCRILEISFGADRGALNKSLLWFLANKS